MLLVCYQFATIRGARQAQLGISVARHAQTLADVSYCREYFCAWLLQDSAAWAFRAAPQPLLPVSHAPGVEARGGVVQGFREFAARVAIPEPLAANLHDECVSLGAVHVDELTLDDWSSLPSWRQLRPLQQWRLTAALQ